MPSPQEGFIPKSELIHNMYTYLRLHILTLGSVWKQDRHTRVPVSTKKPFVGSRQQEHKRVESSDTTCGIEDTAVLGLG